jgi:hypothetical protein
MCLVPPKNEKLSADLPSTDSFLIIQLNCAMPVPAAIEITK